jgi:chaperonin GroES
MSASGTIDKLTPLRDLVLVKLAPAEETTTGGLVLPDAMKTKPTSGDVVGAGPQASGLKAGDCVLYSKFGVSFTELTVAGEEHILMRESDVMGVMPKSPANSADVPDMKPLADKVLLKIEKPAAQSSTGLIMETMAEGEEKYCVGEVVATGPGGDDVEMAVAAGDRALLSKYAGDKLFTPDGEEYVCVPQSDLMGIL